MGSFDLKVVVKDLPIDQIFENVGQIPDVPENPRRITDEDFELLKKSIQESPEMKNLDEVKVYPFEGKYIAIGGNHRLRAYKELEWKNEAEILTASGDVKATREDVLITADKLEASESFNKIKAIGHAHIERDADKAKAMAAEQTGGKSDEKK